MTKLTRSEQARINGAKSKGPTSKEGKLVSSMNRFIHGRRSRHYALLTDEDRAAFEALQDELFRCYLPRTSVEANLVAQLATVEWGKLRVDAMELAILNHEYAIQRDALIAARCDTDPALTTALATSHVVQNSKLPNFLANRSVQYVRERASILRTLEKYRKLSADAATLKEVFAGQQDVPDSGPSFEPHSNPRASRRLRSRTSAASSRGCCRRPRCRSSSAGT